MDDIEEIEEDIPIPEDEDELSPKRLFFIVDTQ